MQISLKEVGFTALHLRLFGYGVVIHRRSKLKHSSVPEQLQFKNSYTIPICTVWSFTSSKNSSVGHVPRHHACFFINKLLGTHPIVNRSRLKILYALSHDQELCVCDIATLLNAKVATASHHLRKLRDLKILKYRNDGKLAYYSLRDQRVSDILNYSLKQVVG